MMKTALVMRHVHFEDLGSFVEPLQEAGYNYEEEAYPFVAAERAFMAMRLASRLPMLGVCLGAQLIAAALEARMYSTGLKEIDR